MCFQMVAFTEKIDDIGTASRAFDQAKEKTLANMRYLERNLDDLKDWLEKAVSQSVNPGSVVG